MFSSSGLLLNAAGTLAWVAWRPGGIPVLVDVNVLCLAVGSIVWTLLQFVYPQGIAHIRQGDKPLPFAHLAAGLAISVLGVLAAVNITMDLMSISTRSNRSLGLVRLGGNDGCRGIVSVGSHSKASAARIVYIGHNGDVHGMGLSGRITTDALLASRLGSVGLCSRYSHCRLVIA